MSTRFSRLFWLFIPFLFLFFSAAAIAANDEIVVQEHALANGLKILTCEVHNAPIIYSQISYKVGSRNETYGKTGISHLVEHMMFKGTPRYPKGVISKLIKKAGGVFNAFTDKDITAYFEQIPKNKIDIVLDIESERMMNCVFDDEEFQLEREVVKEERRMRTDDSPIGVFREEMMAMAFYSHPLHHPVIGWMGDINAITRDQAFEYYKTYYTPNNATLVLVGDFETEQILKKVKKYFGRIPRGPEVPSVVSYFEEQRTRREFTLRRPDVRLSTVELAFHVPGNGHPDEAALQIAGNFLGGSVFSPIRQKLIHEKKWARTCAVRYFRGKDPDLFRFLVKIFPDKIAKMDSVITTIFSVIEQMQQTPISEYNLQKVRNQLAYNEVFKNQKVSRIGSRLSKYETYSSWKDAEKFQQALEQVTPQDVQQVMQKYFSEDKVTIGRLVPREYFADEKELSARRKYKNHNFKHHEVADFDFSEWEIDDLKKDIVPPNPFAHRIRKAKLKNGIEILGIADHTLPVFYLGGMINTGWVTEEQDFCGITSFLSKIMNQGTRKRSYMDIAKIKEFYPISFDVNGSNGKITFSGSGLVENVDSLLALGNEILRFPSFPEKEMQRACKSRRSILKSADARGGWKIGSYLFETVYGGHPYGNIPDIKKFRLDKISRADLMRLHQKYVRPERMKLVILGDFEFEEMVAKIDTHFGDWHNSSDFAQQAFPELTPYTGRSVKVFSMPEKKQVEIRIGTSWPGKSAPRGEVLELLNYILGGSSLTSRLGTYIRDEQGLAYRINTKVRQRQQGGIWFVATKTAPENVKHLIHSALEVIKKTREEGITARELKDAKVFFLQTLPMYNEAPGDLFQTFFDLIRDHKPLNDFDNYYNRILDVSLEEINQLAREVLIEEHYVITVAGAIPEDFLDEFK